MKKFQNLIFLVTVTFFVLFLSLFHTKSVSAQECTGLTAAPNLFRINREPTQAILYFSPVTDANNYIFLPGISNIYRWKNLRDKFEKGYLADAFPLWL